jgi:6-phosphogluconate dehydrogenase
MQLGFIGLGKMGSRMAEKLVKDGHTLVVWNRSKEPSTALATQCTPQHVVIAESVKELVQQLSTPRAIWLMLPAGDVTESMLHEVAQYVARGDIVIDGSNNSYVESDNHAQFFAEKGIRFLGIGVSGGIIALRDGYPLMVGGDASAYQQVTPILESLAKPHGGHAYFGKGGAGHYVKMVHNGIEYPIMQALGEGFGILEKSPYQLNLLQVAQLYQQGSLISGFMLDRVVDALRNDPQLTHSVGPIGSASRETIWTIAEAKKNNLPVESIAQAHDFRERSQHDTHIQRSFAARMISALRLAFGGHSQEKKV